MIVCVREYERMREIVSARVSMRERTGVSEGEASWERESVCVRERI